MILIRENQYGDIDLHRHPTLRSFHVGRVRGHLWLWGCPLLRSLPDTLEVGGSLGLEGCASLTGIPATLRVAGSLLLQNTPVSELPDDLEVGLSLWLRGSKVARVPESARIYWGVLGLGET